MNADPEYSEDEFDEGQQLLDSKTRRKSWIKWVGLSLVLILGTGAVTAVMMTRNVADTAVVGFLQVDSFAGRFDAVPISPDGMIQDIPHMEDHYSGVFILHNEAGASFRLDAALNFQSDDGERTRITLSHDRVYVETFQDEELVYVGCGTQDALPPYMLLLERSFPNTVEIPDNAPGGPVQCQGHRRYFEFEDTSFVMCFGSEVAFPDFVVGESFHANIDHVSVLDVDTSELMPPQVDLDGNELVCSALDSRETHSSDFVATGSVEPPTWRWPIENTRSFTTTASKRCVFFHGTGQTEDLPATSTFTDYWGDLHKSTPQCTSRSFGRFDTRHREWTDPELQQMHCDLLSPDENGVVHNTIIFTHSMGNLILGGALGTGKCSLADSSSWYENQAPLSGSKGADVATELCVQWWDWVTSLAEWFGFCYTYEDMSSRTTTIGYDSMRTTEDFTVAQQAIRDNVKGALCGTSAWGLNTMYSPALSALATFIGFGEDNDGMVPWSSCDNLMGYAHGGQWGNSYTDAWYRAAVNHADGTCATGDGWYGNDRRPCRWYASRT